MDNHFLHHPYFLGARPSIADFGMMTGFYPHLSRDTIPCSLMKERAANVYRWVERMNLANIEDGEFPEAGTDYLPNDQLPETLNPILELIFKDWGPVVKASYECYNAWLEANPELPSGTHPNLGGEKKIHPVVGKIDCKLRGIAIERACFSNTLYMFDQALQNYRHMPASSRTELQALFERLGGDHLLLLKMARPMRRENNLLIVD